MAMPSCAKTKALIFCFIDVNDNPINADHISEIPGLLAYPHHIGSAVIKPEDEGKLKHRALSAMREQTQRQLLQIQKQAELLAQQARTINERIQLSENIYQAKMAFEPFVGHTYHLYESHNQWVLLMLGPEEWGKSIPQHLCFKASVSLLSDHTWDIVCTASE